MRHLLFIFVLFCYKAVFVIVFVDQSYHFTFDRYSFPCVPVQALGVPVLCPKRNYSSFPFHFHTSVLFQVLSVTDSQSLLTAHTFKKLKIPLKVVENIWMFCSKASQGEEISGENLSKSCPEGLERQFRLPANISTFPKIFLRPFKTDTLLNSA